jgi:CRISPR-associated protein Cas2
MRMMVFFDLPVETLADRREYAKFRRFLVKSGFMMMQESVYIKLALNQTSIEAIEDNLRKNKPPKGLVQALTVTERQFAKMEYLVGEHSSEVLNDDRRLVIL